MWSTCCRARHPRLAASIAAMTIGGTAGPAAGGEGPAGAAAGGGVAGGPGAGGEGPGAPAAGGEAPAAPAVAGDPVAPAAGWEDLAGAIATGVRGLPDSA